jgi:hypothetical protein
MRNEKAGPITDSAFSLSSEELSTFHPRQAIQQTLAAVLMQTRPEEVSLVEGADYSAWAQIKTLPTPKGISFTWKDRTGW